MVKLNESGALLSQEEKMKVLRDRQEQQLKQREQNLQDRLRKEALKNALILHSKDAPVAKALEAAVAASNALRAANAVVDKELQQFIDPLLRIYDKEEKK